MDEIENVENKMSFANFKKEMAKYSKDLRKQTIYDPADKTETRKSRSYAKYTKEDLLKYLQNPTSFEKELRNASIYLFQTSTRYRRLIESLAGIPTYAFVISPLNFNSSRVKLDSFKKSYQKVSNAIELMCIGDECRKMMITCLRNGVYYGVRWQDSASSFVQQLDPDYCVITHVSDGTFLFAFDCSRLTESKLPYYPPQFAEMYLAYKETGNKYQLVPPEISVCLKADPTTIEYSIPPFAGAMPSLYDIAKAEEVAGNADEISNYKVLYGEIETDENGDPKLTYDEIISYYQMLCNNVGEKVGVAVGPFSMKAFDFERSGAATEVNMVARAVDNYWSTVGSSSVLHGASNSTAGVTKLALKNDESYALALLKQCERIINRYLKTSFGGTYKFKVTFLPITIYNYSDMVHEYKTSATLGLGKMQYAASLAIPQYDISGLDYIEDNIIDIDDSLTGLGKNDTDDDSAGEEDQGVGRPAVDDTELDAEGESTRENDTNANR